MDNGVVCDYKLDTTVYGRHSSYQFTCDVNRVDKQMNIFNKTSSNTTNTRTVISTMCCSVDISGSFTGRTGSLHVHSVYRSTLHQVSSILITDYVLFRHFSVQQVLFKRFVISTYKVHRTVSYIPEQVHSRNVARSIPYSFLLAPNSHTYM